MNEPTMTAFNANPYIYIFTAVAVGAVLLYVVFYVINQTGLEVHTSTAIIVDKQFTASGKTYNTNIVAGRSFVQSHETPETYAVVLDVGNERTVGLVSKQMFESLNIDDRVNVKSRRTRITGKLQVIEVNR